MRVGNGNLEDCGLLGQSVVLHQLPISAGVAQAQADINLVDKRGQSPLCLGSHDQLHGSTTRGEPCTLADLCDLQRAIYEI